MEKRLIPILFPIFFILSLLMSSCNVYGQYIELKETPVFGTEPGLENSRILYEDDFSNSESGWQIFQSKAGSSANYEHEGFRIIVSEVEMDYWSIQNIMIADVQLAVDSIKMSGPDNNLFGLICRFTEENNYYAFVISSDGYYAILKMINGQYSLLSGDHMDFHDAINNGRGTNRLRADCIGDQLVLYVNNVKLETVIDGDLSEGRIGLIAGTKDLPGTDILFDNFILYQP